MLRYYGRLPQIPDGLGMKFLCKYRPGHSNSSAYSIESLESLGALSNGKSATTSDGDHAWEGGDAVEEVVGNRERLFLKVD